MYLRFRSLLLIAFALPAWAVSMAHMPRAGQLPKAGTIRISANLVQVPVSVTDAAGHPVRDLDLEDFRLEENDRPVVLDHIGEPGETSLQIVLAFDNSGSVFTNYDLERQAATSFLQRIFRKGDTISILCFGSTPKVIVRQSNSLGDSLKGLEEIKATQGSTAFFDAVIAAARVLNVSADPDTRRVQVVLSDGEDNFSDRNLIDAVREVQQDDCLFYSINPTGATLRSNVSGIRGQKAMETLAVQTGGTAFLIDNKDALPEIYDRIAAELQSQYLLTYYSPEPVTDGNFRRIVVRVPKLPELRLRARQGYYPARATSK